MMLMDIPTLKVNFYALSGADGSASKEEIAAWLGGLIDEVGWEVAPEAVDEFTTALFSLDIDSNAVLTWGEFLAGCRRVAAN